MFDALWHSILSQTNISNSAAGYKQKDLDFLGQLAAEGVIHAVIDRTLALSQLKEAHEYVESGNKLGHVVINNLVS